MFEILKIRGEKKIFLKKVPVKDQGVEVGQNALFTDLRKTSGGFSDQSSHTVTVT